VSLIAPIEHSIAFGIAVIRMWDAVEDRPCDCPTRVRALRASDLHPIATATMHPGGVHGFLKLAPGTYELLTEPLRRGFLPCMRTLTIPPLPPPGSPPPPPIPLDVKLRSSSRYVRPNHTAAVRGTVQWSSTKQPARWACIFGWLQRVAGPPTAIGATFTRTDARGEFQLILRHPPPNSDGTVFEYEVHVEVHATTPPPTTTLADDDYSDLPLDDGTDAAIRAAQPLSRLLTPTLCQPGDDLSLNTDTYDQTDPKTGVTLSQTVILLT
jgi:hypothetical protein